VSQPADDTALPAAVLEQLPAVVWVFTGPDHVAVLANREGRQYRGGSRIHLLGRSLRESVAEENRPLVALLDEVYRTGVSRTYYETPVRVDGEERLVTFTATPLRAGPAGDEPGAIVGVISYLTDVTDTVIAKRAAEREHAALQTLQERLLPAGLPVLPGLRVAARYRAAGEQLVAGGDWYDAIVLAPGRIGASVGDVVGHGPGAAASMGQLRSVLSAALLNHEDAAQALVHLAAFTRTMPAARGSTACAAIVDTATGLVRYASAGHPPPVLLRPEGTADFVPATPSAPLAMPGPGPVEHELTLEPGQALLLYSDGVVERPGVPTEHGRQRLLAACAKSAGEGTPPDDLLDTLLDDVGGGSGADDIALLLLHRPVAPVPGLHARVPAQPGELSGLRRRLRGWLAEVGVSDEDATAMQVACGEATTNAVEHAYAGGPGAVDISATLRDDGTVLVEVRDEGRWRPPPAAPANRGRGLQLMQGCTDDVQLLHGPGGTAVRLVRAVHASRSTPTPAPAFDATRPTPLVVHLDPAEDGVHARLTGDLDAAAIDTATTTLRHATRGGAVPLTLDLTGLDHLTSTGVRLLFTLAAEHHTAGTHLAVHLTQGSTAHHVLELTGFHAVPGVSPGEAD
jgi:anti-anti-sigma factor